MCLDLNCNWTHFDPLDISEISNNVSNVESSKKGDVPIEVSAKLTYRC